MAALSCLSHVVRPLIQGLADPGSEPSSPRASITQMCLHGAPASRAQVGHHAGPSPAVLLEMAPEQLGEGDVQGRIKCRSWKVFVCRDGCSSRTLGVQPGPLLPVGWRVAVAQPQQEL